MINRSLFGASALALLVAAPAFAQGALVGVESLDDRIDDIQEAVDDDFAESNDSVRFGQNQYAQGWTGSVALGFTATSATVDTTDLDLAGRFRYGNGPWNHTVGFAAEFSEADGVKGKEELFVTYDVNRYFSEQFYVFGLGSVRYDELGANKVDAFLGFGPGYRIINQPNQTWRLQVGPGVRYIEDSAGDTTTEVAGIASSRYYRAFTENVFLTNDTDILSSSEDTIVTNDLGINFKMSDALSTRVSYRSEWDSNPLTNFSASDNTVGVSLVYGF